MAGSNPGMVIKVAADIAAAEQAFADVAGAAADTAGAITDLGNQAPDDLANVESALADVEGAADDTSVGVVALGAAIGTMAAEAIGALVGLAIEGVKELGKELFDVIDDVLGLKEGWSGLKTELAETLITSGGLKAGFDALGESVLRAFGGTREQAVRTVADLIERGALKVLDLTEALITLGEYGARGIAALIVPIDAVLLTIGELGQKYSAFVLYLLDTAAQLPLVGGKYKELADEVRGVEGSFASWRDEQRLNIDTHAEMVTGQGALFEWTGKAKGAIDESRDAILKQREAAAEAATSVGDLSEGWGTFVQGSGAAVLALADQNEQLAAMDDWSRKINNNNPYGVMLDGLTKVLPPLAEVAVVADDATVSLDAVGTEAIDMSDDVRFAAEVVQKAALTWSDAMDLVRQGQGTMTGTIGKATKPAGMSETEWKLMQERPKEWEQRFGYAWDRPAGAGGFGLMDQFGAGTSGTTVNQSVTVNTVAGDKYAIANVVKDALTDDWRRQGVKG